LALSFSGSDSVALDKNTVPVGLNDEITVGQYYVTLPIGSVTQGVMSVVALNLVKGRDIPLPGVGKTVNIPEFEFRDGKVKIEVDVIENPFPVAALIAGIAIIAGLGLVAVGLASVEKIVEKSPDFVGQVGESIVSIGFVVLLIVGVWLWASGKFS
jgi:hypothetical protein